jgi:hypothetical protein
MLTGLITLFFFNQTYSLLLDSLFFYEFKQKTLWLPLFIPILLLITIPRMWGRKVIEKHIRFLQEDWNENFFWWGACIWSLRNALPLFHSLLSFFLFLYRLLKFRTGWIFRKKKMLKYNLLCSFEGIVFVNGMWHLDELFIFFWPHLKIMKFAFSVLECLF